MAPGPRERLISSAIGLVRRHGVAGTGITELLAASNAARRSVYQHFPGGKHELIAESTRVAGKAISAAIATAATTDDPLDGLASFVRGWKDTLTASDFTAGCPIVAAALAGTDAPGVPAVAAAAFAEWNDLISAQLATAGIEPEAARSLATMAISSVEGAVVLAICSRSLQPLDRVHRHLTELVEHHLPNTAPSTTDAKTAYAPRP
ncbi:TetR/AcrR family transcriptional regulator [Streptomyces halobius]|uniref:TetR/AcrR family transcriptional regulator n=1 Tax=Streptomyces halobius TaxID=2879846 RepID=A0ABY4M5D8_9ACTN|nr:TetR/AcrR family transcriptional regulator [Streptomyces halobius]UQA92039.1 TetR/AcrR family transcriptional regulator [Streptomyces halobius]